MVTLPERVQRTIRHLLTLIEHPNTGEDERDIARRMLQRIREAHQLDHDGPAQVGGDAVTGEAPEPGTVGHPWLYNPGAWAGSKYHQARTLSLTEIAKLIRADLTLARTVGQAAAGPDAVVVPDPIADAPAQIKYSVRTRYGSLHGRSTWRSATAPGLGMDGRHRRVRPARCASRPLPWWR